MAVAEIPATGSTVPSRQGQVWCTPSEAQRLLKFNTFSRQRPYRPWYAQYLAKEMEQDRFLPLTRIEFVEVDGKPVLVDGQHRLNAIVISGRPQILDVVYFEDCDQATLAEYYSRHDAGIPRSQGDRIKALGLAETVGVTQTQAMWAVSAMRIVLASFNGRVRGRLSPEDISTSVKAYRDGLHLFVRTIAGCPSEMITPLTRAATVSVALATCQDAPATLGLEKLVEFWSGVAFDDGLKIGDPRKTLNKDLLTTGMSTGTFSARALRIVSLDEAVWRVARCWNAWADGENVHNIKPPSTVLPVRILHTRFDAAPKAVR